MNSKEKKNRVYHLSLVENMSGPTVPEAVQTVTPTSTFGGIAPSFWCEIFGILSILVGNTLDPDP